MTGRRAGLALALAMVLAAVLGGAGDAGAQDASLSRAQAAALARRAVTDDDALARLRQVQRVDGHDVDLGAATAGLGDQRSERLTELASAFSRAPSAGGEAGDPQALARQVLDRSKFQDKRLPKPFRGPMRWLADRFRPVTDALGSIVDALAAFPGGPFVLLGIVGVGFGALAAWLVLRRSRTAVSVDARTWLVDPRADPAALEREADAAEAAGDHALAVRRRYEAGLVRLAAADRIDLRPDTTPSGVAAVLGDPTLAQLTATFEAVVYGSAPAAPDDAAAARTGWRTVLGGGRR